MRSWGPLLACTGPAPRPANSASGGQVAGELLRLVRIELRAFELLTLPARAPRWPRWTVDPAAGRRALLRAAGGLHGPAPQPATSASGGQVADELLHLVRIELRTFELLALPAGAPRRLPVSTAPGTAHKL